MKDKDFWFSTRCCGKEYCLESKNFDPAPNGICKWCGSVWTKGLTISKPKDK